MNLRGMGTDHYRLLLLFLSEELWLWILAVMVIARQILLCRGWLSVFIGSPHGGLVVQSLPMSQPASQRAGGWVCGTEVL